MDNKNRKGNTVEIIDIEKYHDIERTEEVNDIIERMPKNFGYWITSIVLFISLLLVFFGWNIRYPDVISGQITISTSIAPVKLVSMESGKIKLISDSSQATVNLGDVIGYIESATSYDTLQSIKNTIDGHIPINFDDPFLLSKLPHRISLGELTAKYYNFLGNLHQMTNFNNDKLYDKQITSLRNLRKYQLSEIENSVERININKDVLGYSEKFLKRDSILFVGKVTAEAEFDRANLDYLNNKASYSNARSSRIEAEKQAQQTQSQITQVEVQKSEKKKELEIALLASYNDLIDHIRIWEQRYLFKAPFKGQVQFLRFWTDGQFVQAGEPVFTVVPEAKTPFGQVSLPAVGAGKVKVGQEVIVKLHDFPYNEYGSISGTVNSISLTTNTEKTEQGSIEVYLVTVKFPKGLLTNYEKKISFRHEAKGTAEIITKDRMLIERLFDNLRYVLNK